MKISTRLAVGFLTAVALIVPAAFLSLHTFGRIHEEFEVLKEDVIPGAIAVAEMERVATEAHHHLMEYMVHGKDEDEKLARSHLEALEKAGLEHLEHERHIGPGEKGAAEQLLAKTRRFASALMAIIDLKKQGVGAHQLSRIEDETVCPAAAALAEQVRKHKAVHVAKVAEAERAVHAAHVRGERALILATVLAAVMAVAAALITSRSIVRPLRDLERGTELVAQGDLDHKVGTKRKDEVGQLSRSFDRMTADLSRTLVSKGVLAETNRRLAAEISDRKRADRRLRESEERLSVTLASIGDAVIATDTDGRVTRLNRVGEELTGWTLEEAKGRPLEDVFNIVNEETRAAAPSPVAKVLASGQIGGLANHTVLIARDGTERAIADSAAPIRDPSGRTIGVVLIFRDVTGQRQRQKEKEQLLGDLGERIKELNCLYGLSRIVENPAATIEKVLSQTVQLIPPAWRYPEIANARIRWNEQVFETDNYAETPWCISSDILVGGRKQGSVAVCYRQLKPEVDEGPFLKEERNLINALAERLGKIIERKQAEHKLKQTLAEVEKFNRLATGRELRMVELKGEVNELARKAGTAPPYDLAFAAQSAGGDDDT